MKRLATVVLGVAVGMAGCGENLTTGSALYNRHCGACHGQGDLGGQVGPALGAGSEAAALTDDEYRTVVREGAEDMPPNTRLTDEQLTKIIAYVREVQGP